MSTTSRGSRQFLGLGTDADSAEVEVQYQELQSFLDLRTVPRILRPWAIRQRALVDEAYAAADPDEASGTSPRQATTSEDGDVDEDEDDGESDEEPEPDPELDDIPKRRTSASVKTTRSDYRDDLGDEVGDDADDKSVKGVKENGGSARPAGSRPSAASSSSAPPSFPSASFAKAPLGKAPLAKNGTFEIVTEDQAPRPGRTAVL